MVARKLRLSELCAKCSVLAFALQVNTCKLVHYIPMYIYIHIHTRKCSSMTCVLCKLFNICRAHVYLFFLKKKKHLALFAAHLSEQGGGIVWRFRGANVADLDHYPWYIDG